MNLGRFDGIMDCVDDDFDESDMIPSEKYDEDEANLEELINYVKNCNIEEEIIEPERRREIDIYMIQRKDAMRMEKLSPLHAKACLPKKRLFYCPRVFTEGSGRTNGG